MNMLGHRIFAILLIVLLVLFDVAAYNNTRDLPGFWDGFTIAVTIVINIILTGCAIVYFVVNSDDITQKP